MLPGSPGTSIRIREMWLINALQDMRLPPSLQLDGALSGVSLQSHNGRCTRWLSNRLASQSFFLGHKFARNN